MLEIVNKLREGNIFALFILRLGIMRELLSFACITFKEDEENNGRFVSDCRYGGIQG